MYWSVSANWCWITKPSTICAGFVSNAHFSVALFQQKNTHNSINDMKLKWGWGVNSGSSMWFSTDRWICCDWHYLGRLGRCSAPGSSCQDNDQGLWEWARCHRAEPGVMSVVGCRTHKLQPFIEHDIEILVDYIMLLHVITKILNSFFDKIWFLALFLFWSMTFFSHGARLILLLWCLLADTSQKPVSAVNAKHLYNF